MRINFVKYTLLLDKFHLQMFRFGTRKDGV